VTEEHPVKLDGRGAEAEEARELFGRREAHRAVREGRCHEAPGFVELLRVEPHHELDSVCFVTKDRDGGALAVLVFVPGNAKDVRELDVRSGRSGDVRRSCVAGGKTAIMSSRKWRT